MKLRAIYGDIHGCIKELKELYNKIETIYPGIEHWHLGDLIDRGPDSGACIDFVQKYFTGGVRGNHEDTIISMVERNRSYGYVPKNPDKLATMEQITRRRFDYIKALPPLHVFDDIGLIIVHGGILPGVPLYAQNPHLCIRAQMVIPGRQELHNRWWGGEATRQPKIGKTEKESYAEGYRRWYTVYDDEYDCIFGHSVMGVKPFIHKTEHYGTVIGIDTGSCFGGNLTACIYPELKFIQIPCDMYVIGKNVQHFKNLDKGE